MHCRIVEAFYSAVVEKVVTVSSPDVAEAVKITENVFRAVNIALANELKVIFSAMDIDVWEVIDAAKTKPFGYMPFYPGPGLGGHCIPIDPFYLTWKAREFDIATRFIELAGEINRAMPRYVIEALEKGLDRHLGLSLGSARVLIVGLAYKRDVSDIRESPSLKLIELLEDRGTKVDFHDPHVPEVPPTREHAALTGRKSVGLDAASVAGYDAVVIATDHSALDYALLSREARLIVDTRNAIASRGLPADECRQGLSASLALSLSIAGEIPFNPNGVVGPGRGLGTTAKGCAAQPLPVSGSWPEGCGETDLARIWRVDSGKAIRNCHVQDHSPDSRRHIWRCLRPARRTGSPLPNRPSATITRTHDWRSWRFRRAMSGSCAAHCSDAETSPITVGCMAAPRSVTAGDPASSSCRDRPGSQPPSAMRCSVMNVRIATAGPGPIQNAEGRKAA